MGFVIDICIILKRLPWKILKSRPRWLIKKIKRGTLKYFWKRRSTLSSGALPPPSIQALVISRVRNAFNITVWKSWNINLYVKSLSKSSFQTDRENKRESDSKNEKEQKAENVSVAMVVWSVLFVFRSVPAGYRGTKGQTFRINVHATFPRSTSYVYVRSPSSRRIITLFDMGKR